MPDIALLTVTDYSSDRWVFGLVHLNEENVRWLRRMLKRGRRLFDEIPGFLGLRYVFPDGSFYWDPKMPGSTGGPYHEALRAFNQNRTAILVRSRDVPNVYFISTNTEIVIKRDGLFWEDMRGGVRDHKSSFIPEGILALAWCLVCPASERTEAFADLIRLDPHQALEWFEAGVMSPHDGAFKVSLPPASSELLAPLLDHEDESIREYAQAVLGPNQQTPASRSRGPR